MNSCCMCSGTCGHTGPHSFCDVHTNKGYPVYPYQPQYSDETLALKELLIELKKTNERLEEIGRNIRWMVNNR